MDREGRPVDGYVKGNYFERRKETTCSDEDRWEVDKGGFYKFVIGEVERRELDKIDTGRWGSFCAHTESRGLIRLVRKWCKGKGRVDLIS